MNLLKKIGYSLWAVWCIIGLLVALIYALVGMIICFYIVPTKYMHRKAHFLAPQFAKIFLTWSGVRFNIENEHYIDPSKNYVVVLNHSSDLDPLFGSYVFRKLFIKYLGKAEILKYPIFGMAMRKMYIPVHRNNKESRELSLQVMIDTIKKEKCSIFIYPEGTRNKGPELLKPFYDGAFKVALSCQIPIFCATFTNSFFVMKPRSWLIYPQTLKVILSEPITTIGCTDSDIPRLREEVKSNMLDAFAKAGITKLA